MVDEHCVRPLTRGNRQTVRGGMGLISTYGESIFSASDPAIYLFGFFFKWEGWEGGGLYEFNKFKFL